jgi:hypothetical protein
MFLEGTVQNGVVVLDPGSPPLTDHVWTVGELLANAA